jgi:hypothetical protein
VGIIEHNRKFIREELGRRRQRASDGNLDSANRRNAAFILQACLDYSLTVLLASGENEIEQPEARLKAFLPIASAMQYVKEGRAATRQALQDRARPFSRKQGVSRAQLVSPLPKASNFLGQFRPDRSERHNRYVWRIDGEPTGQSQHNIPFIVIGNEDPAVDHIAPGKLESERYYM